MRFADVVAQEAAKTAFLAMVQGDRLPHALMLRGPAGVGKLAFALAAAQYLACHNPGPEDACGACPACHKASQLIHPDLHFTAPIFLQTNGGKTATTDDWMEKLRPAILANPYFSQQEWLGILEAENKQLVIGIAEIRELKKKLLLKAFEGRRKVLILWHAQKMNTEAANALLKLLEEPPDNTVLLLVVEEPAQLLPTIVSRCQLLRLRRLPQTAIEQALRNRGVDELVAREAARLADGSLAGADAILEHASAGLSELYQKWMRLCYEGAFGTLQQWADGLSHEPKETQKLFLQYALHQLRDTLLLQTGVESLVMQPAAELQFLQRFGKALGVEATLYAIDKVEQAVHYLQRNANASLTLLTLSLDLHAAMRRNRAA